MMGGQAAARASTLPVARRCPEGSTSSSSLQRGANGRKGGPSSDGALECAELTLADSCTPPTPQHVPQEPCPEPPFPVQPPSQPVYGGGPTTDVHRSFQVLRHPQQAHISGSLDPSHREGAELSRPNSDSTLVHESLQHRSSTADRVLRGQGAPNDTFTQQHTYRSNDPLPKSNVQEPFLHIASVGTTEEDRVAEKHAQKAALGPGVGKAMAGAFDEEDGLTGQGATMTATATTTTTMTMTGMNPAQQQHSHSAQGSAVAVPGAVDSALPSHAPLNDMGPSRHGNDGTGQPRVRKVFREPPMSLPLHPYSRYCSRCEIVKPLRAHHCRHCGTCVLGMDHHCPWIGQCVGSRNHVYFVSFCFWTCVSVVFADGSGRHARTACAAHVAPLIALGPAPSVPVLTKAFFWTLPSSPGPPNTTPRHITSHQICLAYVFVTLLITLIAPGVRPRPRPAIDGQILAICILSWIFAFFTGSMGATHVRLIMLNQSTIENMTIQSHKHRELARLHREYGFWEFRAKREEHRAMDLEWGDLDRELNLFYTGDRNRLDLLRFEEKKKNTSDGEKGQVQRISTNWSNWEAVMGTKVLAWFSESHVFFFWLFILTSPSRVGPERIVSEELTHSRFLHSFLPLVSSPSTHQPIHPSSLALAMNWN